MCARVCSRACVGGCLPLFACMCGRVSTSVWVWERRGLECGFPVGIGMGMGVGICLVCAQMDERLRIDQKDVEGGVDYSSRDCVLMCAIFHATPPLFPFAPHCHMLAVGTFVHDVRRSHAAPSSVPSHVHSQCPGIFTRSLLLSFPIHSQFLDIFTRPLPLSLAIHTRNSPTFFRGPSFCPLPPYTRNSPP